MATTNEQTETPQSTSPPETEVLKIARKNVSATLWINVFFVVGYTITFGPVFDRYVFQLAPDNKKNETVGLLESISGVTSLIIFLPVAYLVDSDKWYLKCRARLLHRTDGLFLLSMLLLALAIFEDNFYLLFASLILNGVFYELFNSASEALFADSAELVGGRAELYVRRQTYTALAAGCGPLITLCGTLGSRWYYGHKPKSLSSFMGGFMIDNGSGSESAVVTDISSESDYNIENLDTYDGYGIVDSDNIVDNGFQSLRLVSNTNSTDSMSYPSPFLQSCSYSNLNYFNYPGGLLPITKAPKPHPKPDDDNWSMHFMHAVLLSGIVLFLPVVRWIYFYKDLPEDKVRTSQSSGFVPGSAENSPSNAANYRASIGSPRGLIVNASNSKDTPVTSELGPGSSSTNQARDIMLKNTTDSEYSSAASNQGLNSGTLNSAESNNENPPTSESTPASGPSTSSAALTPAQLEALTLSKLTYMQTFVPYFCASCDFIVCIGAGMTVKYFNLFFINDYKFGPLAILLIQSVYPCVIALFIQILGYLVKKKKLGRAQVSFTAFALNALIFLILGSKSELIKDNESLLLLLFLVRGGLANGVNPLDRSILMDFTPSSARGRWNAIESFTSLTWSGSAFIGGYISDKADYRTTFQFTGMLYMVALMFYFPLLWLVPREPSLREALGIKEEGGESGNESENTNSDTRVVVQGQPLNSNSNGTNNGNAAAEQA